MTSKPLVRRTFATFRSAEFGFLGVVVYTRVQTPRRKGFDLSAGDFSFLITSRRLRRTSWLIVGIYEETAGKKTPPKAGRERPTKLGGNPVTVNGKTGRGNGLQSFGRSYRALPERSPATASTGSASRARIAAAKGPSKCALLLA